MQISSFAAFRRSSRIREWAVVDLLYVFLPLMLLLSTVAAAALSENARAAEVLCAFANSLPSEVHTGDTVVQLNQMLMQITY